MSDQKGRQPRKYDVLKWALPVISVGLTLLIAIGIIRWMAPHLLGIPVNLQMVRVGKETPPFFDNVFRRADYASTDFLLPDPILKRGRPLYPDLLESGPHDILGFRNRAVPNCADIVIIGDSQTYGNNVPLEENWPSRMAAVLPRGTTAYSMAMGGWGAVEYLEAFPKSCHFLPRIVVVTFYTGNDALESFVLAYSQERWASLQPNSSLKASDSPAVPFPAPSSEWWTASFKNGQSIIFTPDLRLASNQDHPAVNAGYDIMAETARRLASLAGEIGINVVFTVIPTKELAYAARIEKEGITPPPAFTRLIQAESARIARLTDALRAIPHARIVDLVPPLQAAAMTRQDLYPASENGHPLGGGYQIIGETMGKAVQDLIPVQPQGVFLVPIGHGRTAYFLIRDQKRWFFESESILRANGWRPESIGRIQPRDVANIPFGGTIRTADPRAFGPRKGP